MRAAPGLTELREQLSARRAQAIQRFRQQRRPQWLLRQLCRLTDATVKGVLRHCPLPADAALVAVGGYGRGELYPHSDVDLVILLAAPPTTDDEARLAAFIAALWDTGLAPAIRTSPLEPLLALVAQDIRTETALLESRHLSGLRATTDALLAALAERRDPRRFFLAKQAEQRERHARHADTPYALEPDCKEAPGGLRDIQLVRWLARAAGHALPASPPGAGAELPADHLPGEDWRSLWRQGLLSMAEARALRRAESAFQRLRIELHLLAGRREDRVLFEWQPALAAAYGFRDAPGRPASTWLMQRYYWAARMVSLLGTLIVQGVQEQLFAADDPPPVALDADFRAIGARLDTRRADAFERNPALLLRAFIVWQSHPGLHTFSARLLRAMWHARTRIDANFRRNPVNRHAFLAILQADDGIVRSLRLLDLLGLLPRYLPVYRRIVGQLQHDLFHAYTVDQHILRVIRALRRYTQPEHADEYPFAHALMRRFEQPWLLYVAALFHDIAKGRGGNHSILGAQDARRFCVAHGLSTEETDLVVFLVREHLTLSITAQKHDYTDPAVLQGFLDAVQTPERLTALFLLTTADIRATGPRVWNLWKAELLAGLYRLALSQLGDGSDATGRTADQAARRRREAASLLGHDDAEPPPLARWWDAVGPGYFLRFQPEEIAWHAQQLASPDAMVVEAVHVRPLALAAALQFLVHVPDRPDLFVTLCQFFDQHRLDVQEARIYTTPQGWALDSFIVLPPADLADGPWTESALARALAGRLREPDPAAVAMHRRISRQARLVPLAPDIELQPAGDAQTWRLYVTAADQPGLLLAMARVFAQHNLQTRTAKILTLGDRIEDVFLVQGAVLADPAGRAAFIESLRAALRQPERAPLPTTAS